MLEALRSLDRSADFDSCQLSAPSQPAKEMHTPPHDECLRHEKRRLSSHVTHCVNSTRGRLQRRLVKRKKKKETKKTLLTEAGAGTDVRYPFRCFQIRRCRNRTQIAPENRRSRNSGGRGALSRQHYETIHRLPELSIPSHCPESYKIADTGTRDEIRNR